MFTRKTGQDLAGNPVKIGDTDTDGTRVGFFQNDGTAWESRQERDGAIASGRFTEAAVLYQNGERRRPRRWLYALRYAPLNFRHALIEIGYGVEFQREFGRSRGKLTKSV